MNSQLAINIKQQTNRLEILKFFGILVLISRHQFGTRRDFWLSVSKFKYISAPKFGVIMPRHRFETLRSCIRFSDNVNMGDDGFQNRWSLVDYFVTAINRHCSMYVNPTELICVDGSMPRWYGLCGEWIDVGLPNYRAFDRKPESGYEIKTSAFGRSEIMLKMQIVKGYESEEKRDKNEFLTHTSSITRQLVEPWKNTNRIVCGDSYFAFVNTVKQLYDIGLRFIGVVKTAHCHFLAQYLGSVIMEGREKWFSVVHHGSDRNCDIGTFLWVDRERRYFVTSVGTTLPGTNIYREKWRKIGNLSKRIVTETAIPQIAETYYAAASQIDRHNHCCQQDLHLEKKFKVREWSMRVNTSLLDIRIVDSWLLYKGSLGCRDLMTSNDYFSKLAEQMIDNDVCLLTTRSSTEASTPAAVLSSGIGTHLTPNTRKRKRSDGFATNAFYQGRCTECKNGTKSKYTCSECTQFKKTDAWICHSSTGRDCFSKHLVRYHIDE